jgi:flavin-dependent dehydrogenase
MSKNKLLITAGLIGALLAAPAFAAKDKDDEADYKARYKEHFQQRHQMGVDMMQTMIDTMTILRDLNHQPTAEEKKHLSDMIKQMNDMMAKHKEMDEKAMKYMDEGMGGRMMGGPRHDMR